MVAHAGPSALLTARVSADLRTVEGTLVVPGATFVSPLPLPNPITDLDRFRTWPGVPDPGSVTWTTLDDGSLSFHTVLPERFGGVGHSRLGLHALGGFYPQPLIDGRPPEGLDWTVSITLPPGRTGLVGETLGTGEITWTGHAERVALAVPRRGEVQSIGGLTVLSNGPMRRVLRRQLTALVPSLPLHRPVVLVEAPLRRRLHRHAPGVAFVSDRAFRLTWPFHLTQRPAFVEGIMAAHSQLPSPQLRAFVGRNWADAWMDANQAVSADRATRLLSWVPSVDLLLSSRRMAFFGDTFREIQPGDALQDDLFEVWAPSRPGADLLQQVRDRSTPEAASRVASGLEEGLSFAQAMQLQGLTAGCLRAPVSPQDYVLTLGPETTVERRAPLTACPEALTLRVDGLLQTHLLAPGDAATLPRPRTIVVDPKRALAQTDRAGDAFPVERLRVVTSLDLHTINLTRFRLEATGHLSVRSRNDTHNLFYGSISTTRTALFGLTLGYLRRFGPLQDGLRRRNTLSFSAGPSVLNPTFLSVEDGRLALAGGARWRWTDQTSRIFPLAGRQVSVGVGGGVHPSGRTRWWSTDAEISAVRALHPRFAVAGSLSTALAGATETDRLLALGGEGRMASLPVLPPCATDTELDCAQVADARGILKTELRFVPLRGASVPMLLLWGTELQVTAGLEGLVARVDRGPARALGATVGVSGVYDLFGAEPGLIGLSAGWLLESQGIPYAPVRPAVPEIFLRWTQSM